MQLYCNNSEARTDRGGPRGGLTLVELVVVLAILVALSGLIVPLISGLGHQTNASTGATLIADVNRAVNAFHARAGDVNQYPDAWDSLLNTNGSLFNKLHPALTGSDAASYGAALLQVVDLSPSQAESLRSAGIYNLYRADESSTVAPSLNEATSVSVTTGAKAAILDVAATAGSSPYDKLVFATDLANASGITAGEGEFIVLGVGFNSTLRGATLVEVPLVQGADPANYYARMLCVFMVPSSAATTSFPARYVGCFLPDGTSLRNNLDKYNNALTSN